MTVERPTNTDRRSPSGVAPSMPGLSWDALAVPRAAGADYRRVSYWQTRWRGGAL